jgi:Uma2 family endonuclease
MARRIDEQAQLTLEEYEALPDDDAYFDEVSRGYLVREPRPGSAHGRLVALLSHRLMQYVDQHPRCGRVYTEAGFVLALNPLTVRGPDVAFVRAERAHHGYVPQIFRGAPDLAIEVLSPSNRAGEILNKVSEFLDAGTAVVWVVDPAQKIIVVHDQTVTPRVLRVPERLACEELLPNFELDIAALFSEY